MYIYILFGWRPCIPTQDRARVQHDLRYEGNDSIMDLADAKKSDCEALAQCADLTAKVVAIRNAPAGPMMATMSVALHKPAVMCFQCWHYRSPGLVGVLLARESGKRRVCVSIVVDKDLNAPLESEKIKRACGDYGLHICGVILGGVADDSNTSAQANKYISELVSHGCDHPVCVFVPGLCLVSILTVLFLVLSFSCYIYILFFVSFFHAPFIFLSFSYDKLYIYIIAFHFFAVPFVFLSFAGWL